MPFGGALIGGIGALGSAVVGGIEANNQENDANAARQQAVAQWLSVNVPDPERQKIELQNYQLTGELSPEMEQAFQQSQTAMNGISLDPTSRSAEMSALAQMQGLASSNGLDPQAKAAEQQAINQSNANEQGQRNAIVQNAMARGMGQGGGAMLAAQLQASQGDANQAAAMGLQSASDARMRALQALSDSANLGATVNSQDYSQAAARAQAQDAINRFNTQNAQNVANQNVSNTNAAQATNLANAQAVANANTGVANQQEVSNKGLYQQQFQNEVTKAAGASGQYGQQAAQDNANATNTANMWSGIGQAIAKGAGAYGQYINSQSKPSSSSSGYTGQNGNGYNYTDENDVDFIGPTKPSGLAKGGMVPSNFDRIMKIVRQQKGQPRAA